MTSDEFDQFRHDAVHALMDLCEVCRRRYRMGTWPRFDYDLDAGTLTFSEAGVPSVIANIQVVGTTSDKTHTWLWAWANASLPPNVTERVRQVQQFGMSEGLDQLTEPKLPDGEFLGWEQTAVMARIVGAQGGYRCPSSNGFIYFILTDIQFADSYVAPSPAPNPDAERVNCEVHGPGQQTFVCAHLVSDPNQKWLSDEPSAANRWPDSWCEECDALHRERGEWTDDNSGQLGIKLLCHLCYESLRVQGIVRP
jgi:hypothetical protein